MVGRDPGAAMFVAATDAGPRAVMAAWSASRSGSQIPVKTAKTVEGGAAGTRKSSLGSNPNPISSRRRLLGALPSADHAVSNAYVAKGLPRHTV